MNNTNYYNIVRICILTLCAILFKFSTYSQSFNFKTYNAEHGLAQTYVYSVVQGKDGYLWIGTGGGLYRFDGKNFVVYTEQDGLAASFITSLLIDNMGNLWIGHFQGEITKYNGNEFEIINSGTKANSTINAIYEDNAGNILFGTKQNGIILIDKLNNKKIYNDDDLSSMLINSIVQCNDNSFLIGTNNGLFKYNYNRDKSKLVFKHAYKELSESNIQCIVGTKKDNRFWIATGNEGVYELSPSKSIKDSAVFVQYSTSNGLLADNVNTIYEDNEATLWIGLYGQGLSKLTKTISEDTVLVKIRNFNSDVEPSIKYNIKSIFQDNENNIWIGTYGGGLVQFSGEIFSFYTFSNELLNKNILSLLSDSKGYYWLSTQDGLFQCKIDAQIKIKKHFTSKNGLPNSDISALYEDNNGNIWIGTISKGLYLFNPITNNCKQLLGDINLRINSITGDSYENVWIATPTGAFKYNTINFEFNHYTTYHGLAHNNIRHIFVDSKARVWFATYSGSISVYEKGKFIYQELPKKLFNIDANCITEDATGNIWIGTYGQGIFKFKDSIRNNYVVENGLISNYCYSIIADDDNNIWIGHKNGLTKYVQDKASFISYGKEKGFYGTEVNPNAAIQDKDANIWFGTTKGLVKYNAENDKTISAEPLTHITNIEIDNEQQKLIAGLKLPYGQYSIKFDFIGISFKNPDKVKYKYWLEGYDLDWSEFTKANFAQYTRLTDGKYTFKVWACNAEGICNKEPVEYEFVISKPFWAKWWFYAVSAIILFGNIYLFITWRTKQLIKEKNKLESLVDERTKLLQKEKNLVEKQNRIIEQHVKDVTDSIFYAKKIQESILPDKQEIYKLFSDAFIFFKPRDIVSGDFYWLTKKEGKIFLAVVDCTGHGVPGAFMSIIGNTILNKIVNEMKVFDPGKILAEFNKEIIKNLKQKGEQSLLYVGMDIALCVIDEKMASLEFAGAARPLYIVNKKHKLNVIKGSVYSIGGYFETGKNFSTSKINIKKGESIYLFSDGYADQFGGEKDKKFMTKNFKQLLINIQGKSMLKQEEILKQTISDWQRESEQIDDLLVIGIRF